MTEQQLAKVRAVCKGLREQFPDARSLHVSYVRSETRQLYPATELCSEGDWFVFAWISPIAGEVHATLPANGVDYWPADQTLEEIVDCVRLAYDLKPDPNAPALLWPGAMPWRGGT